MSFAVGILKNGNRPRRKCSSICINNRSLVDQFSLHDGIFSLNRTYASKPRSAVSETHANQPSKEVDALQSMQLLSGRRFTVQTSRSGHNNFYSMQQAVRKFSMFHPKSTNQFSLYLSKDGPRAFMTTSSSSSTSYSTSSSSPLSSQSVETSTRKKSWRYSTDVKIPTPKSSPTLSTSLNPLDSIDPKAIKKGIVNFSWSATKTVFKFIIRLPGNFVYYITHPKERKERTTEIKDFAKKEFDHYHVGSKLLIADIKTSFKLILKTLRGSTLTRRERKQLLRTVSDLFRMIPMSMFLLIPFMEFALPFALKFWPNMLPSTFQDSLKNEESMKRELQSRIAMTEFFQETMEELAHAQKRIAAKRKDGNDEPADSIASKQEASASDMLKFLDRARQGEAVPPEVIVQYANYFQDDLTLDNMPRMQLINMCKYMSIPPYGSESFLRFQLRHKIRLLKEDDQRILWEGIDSLTKMELREACQERGMRSTGLSKEVYKRSLQQWLDLSVNMDVPISLLIMSRTFFLRDETISPASAAGSNESQSVTGLADAISGMDKEVLNEVILQVATSEEFKSDPDVRKIKLEVVTHQNEKIEEEQAEIEAKKKKDSSEKEGSQELVEETQNNDTTYKANSSAEAKVTEGKVTKEEILDAIDIKVEELKEDLFLEAAEIEKGERELTPEELESISQLLSDDPVVKERESLDRIKHAMREKAESTLKSAEENESERNPLKFTETNVNTDDSDAITASNIIEEMESKADEEANKNNSFSTEIETVFTSSEDFTPDDDKNALVDDDSDETEDPVVARLKKRIESMVDKIEVQLSDVQVKIGDKLHYLDKDMDGLLSREEMASVLSQVLKNISFEDALVIADEMDDNKDGVFTVQELIKWIETNQLMKFESEGRDAEMDKIMESQTNETDDFGVRS